MSGDPGLSGLVNQRLTLNLLIQGAAAHGAVDAHDRVADALNRLAPGLVGRYDRFEAAAYLAVWYGDFVVATGCRPRTFWRRVDRPDHPFHHHPLLRRHGAELNEQACRWGRRRAWRRRVWPLPGVLFVQMLGLLFRVWRGERGHRSSLARLAAAAAADFWGVPVDRLAGDLAFDVSLRAVREPQTRLGRSLRDAAAGWSQVEALPGGGLGVRAVAWNFPLLAHEFIKGTAELICLHGLGHLDDATYDAVMVEADHIDHELWMLQAGPAYYRRFLALLTPDQTPAAALMHAARMDPDTFELFALAVMEDPARARRLLGDGFDAYDAP